MSSLFSERLRTIREANFMTQKDVAAALNMSIAALSMYERGNREPKTETIIAFATLYHTTTDYLFGLTLDPDLPYQPSPRRSQLSPRVAAAEAANYKTEQSCHDDQPWGQTNLDRTKAQLLEAIGRLHPLTQYKLLASLRDFFQALADHTGGFPD